MLNAKPATDTVDYLILGAGPAGLQLGYFLQRAGRDYWILERADGPGSFFQTFPRHRTLISINKIYTGYDDPETNLRWDWNSLLSDDPDLLFRRYSDRYLPDAADLVRYLADFAARHCLRVSYGAEVVAVDRDRGFRVVTADGGVVHAERLIVASGFTRPYLPAIPGIELAETYFNVSLDPAGFRNQKVLILGKGNSGFETADNLIGAAAILHVASPGSVRMAWKSHFVGHLRAVNNNLLDTYQLKSQNAVLDCTVTALERRGDKLIARVRYSHASEEEEELTYDRVIACTGFRVDDSIFAPACRPELVYDGRLPAQTSAWESPNVPGLYFGGVLMQARDYKKTTSGFIHGFRYNLRALARIFGQRYHGERWPTRPLAATAEGLTAAVIERINRTSALWQQFGFLGDLITVGPGERGEYWEELPVAYVHDGHAGRHDDFFVVTLEFGKCEIDPFAVVRHPQPDRAAESFFLHPVIRHYRDGEQVGEQHLLEDLHGEWKNERLHVGPLRCFFARELAAPEPAAAYSSRSAGTGSSDAAR